MTDIRNHSDDAKTDHRLSVELGNRLTAAYSAAMSILRRFEQGDPCPEAIADLEASVQSILKCVGPSTGLPAPLHADLRRLLDALAEAQRNGARWLDTVLSPEIESTVREQRLRSAYGQRDLPAA